MTRAVFLDRDGTLLEELGYLTPASILRTYPYAIDAVRLLNHAGYAVAVLTNQGGIGRGLYSAEFVERTHDALGAHFASGGAHILSWQFCPHHPDALTSELRGPCECRKPGAGMVAAVAGELGPLDLPASWVIGDQWRDIAVAHAVGGRGILVRTGHGAAQERDWPVDVAAPSAICDNLIAAVAHILGS